MKKGKSKKGRRKSSSGKRTGSTSALAGMLLSPNRLKYGVYLAETTP